MIILLTFAFLSGLITIFAPCIWPLLPIILSSSTTGERSKPLGITLGIITSFALFTLTISYIVRVIPFDPSILRLFAVVIIGFLGLALIIPSLTQLLEGSVSRLSGKLGPVNDPKRKGFGGGFITGFALGIVWTPCAGPILATIATLAATRTVNFQIVLVTLVYVIGVGIPLFIFATVGSYLFTRTRVLSKYTGRIQQVFGVIMVLTAIAIYTNYDKVLQVKLLDAFPGYSNFLIGLESSEGVKNQLDKLRGGNKSADIDLDTKQINMIDEMTGKVLPDYGKAPEFIGISNWINSDKLSMQQLQGKVVLIDFWTYTCINCIRTLPYITSWYEKYKDKGLVIVGIHTPEFEFEKETENVISAIKQYNISYPVAQDNDYATWNAYENRYWPAKYLVDAKGKLRYAHFGEGAYEETEKAIQILLEEAGNKIATNALHVEDEISFGTRTPETYLGTLRMDRLSSLEQVRDGKQIFSLPEGLPMHHFALQGEWNLQPEYSSPSQGSVLELNFSASKVFLVINPAKKGDKVGVRLNSKHPDQTQAGSDVENGIVTLDGDRLYELINLKEKGNYKLQLEFLNEGTKVFAFTFG